MLTFFYYELTFLIYLFVINIYIVKSLCCDFLDARKYGAEEILPRLYVPSLY